MDENATSAAPLEARAVMREAMVQSALLSADRAVEMGLPQTGSSCREVSAVRT